MDLYCQQCGEPWEHYYVVHEMDPELDGGSKKEFLAGKGCPSCHWGKDAPKEKPLVSDAMSAMIDLMGNDLDGVAASLEDFGF